MASNYDAVIASPVGKLGLRLQDGRLCALDFVGRATRLREASGPAARRAVRALDAYFADGHTPCVLPLGLAGTPFQQQVWRALRRIPAGDTMTYGGLAERLGTSARAVGNACRANPVPLLVPCHRVVAARGAGGYDGARGGPRLTVKRWLLEHEGATLAQ